MRALSFQIEYNTPTNTLWLDNTGYVGIGTSAPSKKLHVYNGSSGASAHSWDALVIEDNDNVALNLMTLNTKAASIFFTDPQGTNGQISYSHATDAFSFAPNAATGVKMTIASDGNVYLGGSTVTSSAGGRLIFRSPSNVNGEQVGRIEWWNENGAGIMAKISCIRETSAQAPAGLGFYTSANVDSSANSSEGAWSEKMRITSAGKVGIGTTAPFGRLNVHGATTALGTGIGDSAIFASSSDALAADKGGIIQLGGIYNSSGQVTQWAGIGGFKDNATNNNYAGYMSFYTRAQGAGPVERMRILSGGSVGIGTTTPDMPLVVDTSVAIQTMKLKGRHTGYGSSLQFDATGAGGLNFELVSGGSGTGGGMNNRFSIRDVANNAPRLTIDSAGKIGLGIPAPAGHLHIAESTSGSATIRITNSTTGTGTSSGLRMSLEADENTTIMNHSNTNLNLGVNGLNVISIKDAKVGIGTTAPNSPFHIHTGTDENFLVRAASVLSDGTYILSGNDSNTGLKPIQYGASIHYFMGGNVGIGETAPGGLLHVKGTNSSAGDLWTVVGTGNTPNITIQNASATDNTNAALFFKNDSVYVGGIGMRFTNHSSDAAQMRFSTTSGGTTRERMTLDESGKLGIGTTAPGACLLTVNGLAGFGTSTDGLILSSEAGYGVIQGTDSLGNSFNGLKMRTQGWALTIENSATPDVDIEYGLTVGDFKLSSNIFSANTADGSDNKELYLCAGGAQGSTRGAYIDMTGNDYPTWGGLINIIAGEGANAKIAMTTGGDERLSISTGGVIKLNGVAPNDATQYLHYKAYSNNNAFTINGDAQGRVAIGADVSGLTTCYIGNTHTHRWTGGSGRGMWIDPGHEPNVSQWNYGEVLQIRGSIKEGADPGSGWRTHPWFRGTNFVQPVITAGTATVDNSATVYINGAMSCATNNYSLYVYSGNSYFGGNCAAPSWQVLSSAQGSEVGSIYWANSGMSIRSGNSGDAQFILKGGSVGIGTTAPDNILEISKNSGTATTGANIKNNTVVGLHIANTGNNVGCARSTAIAHIQEGSGSAAMVFYSCFGNAVTTERMRIKADGSQDHKGNRIVNSKTVSDSYRTPEPSLRFNGEATWADKVTVGTTPWETSLASKASTCIWFKRTKSSSGRVYLVDSDGDELTIQIQADSTLRASYNSTSPNATSTVTITNNVWHHVVATYDVGNTIKIYLDGLEVASASAGSADATLTTFVNNIWFGSRAGTSYVLDGEIKDVRFHNRVLSATEIAAVYNGEPTPFEYADASNANLAQISAANPDHLKEAQTTGNFAARNNSAVSAVAITWTGSHGTYAIKAVITANNSGIWGNNTGTSGAIGAGSSAVPDGTLTIGRRYRLSYSINNIDISANIALRCVDCDFSDFNQLPVV